jgi:broad specificity phosphatase PhoE
MHKIIAFTIASLFYFTSIAQKTTYILIRHAEKDTTAAGSTTMNANPPLSKIGENRAVKLINALKDYKVDSIYSTNYLRTTSTVQPLAQKFKKEILVYNPKDLKIFAEKLLQEKNKTFVIVGHSNTTPALVNMLINKEKYKPLDESVYNKIFIITITSQKTTVDVTEY